MTKKLSFALAALLAISPVASTAVYAQAQVTISAEQIAQLVAACEGDGCSAQLLALIAAIQAANPGLSVDAIAAAIAAEVSAGYNAGSVSASLAAAVLDTVASSAGVGPNVANAVQLALASVQGGSPVDFEAIADAGSPS